MIYKGVSQEIRILPRLEDFAKVGKTYNENPRVRAGLSLKIRLQFHYIGFIAQDFMIYRGHTNVSIEI